MGFLEGTLINPLWTRKIGYYLYGIVGTAALFTWLSWDYDTTIINFELRTKEGAAWVYYRWGGRLWYQLYTYCLSSYFLNKVAIGAIIGAVGTYFFIKGLTLSPETKRVIRGATLIDAKVLSKTLKKTKANIHLGVERIPIPEHDERRSFLILGKAGSGKTQAIMRFLEQIKTLNHSAIVYDRKPDYWHRYYRHDKDILFYPKDKRCLRWNIFDDIRDEDDVHFAAMRIIPENPHSKEPYWDNAARDILKTILFHIIDCGKPNNKKLMDFLRTQYTPLSLYNVLKNTAVKYAINIAFHLQTQETAKNVLSTLYSQANSILRREFYYSDSGFSARKWIREIDQNRGCCLYLVVTAAESNSYQTLFRLMIELMVREILSLDENAKRRIWLVLDEFQTLGKLAQMEEGLAQWRSFGGSAIVGTQSLAKVEEIYGKQTLRSFYQNLSTRLVFQYDESDGAKFITDNFGEGEISENQHNRMITRSGDRDISQVQEKISVKKALLPGELSLLKPLECYLKISEYPLTKISFIYKNPQRKHNLEAWELPYFEPLGAVDDDSNDRQKTLDFEKEEISDEPRERSDNENGGTKEAAAIEAQRDI